MASGKPQPSREFFETGSEPEFFVTFHKWEPAGGGNVRCFAYAERRPGQFHLLYTTIMPMADMGQSARRALHAIADAHNIAQWEHEGMTEN
jgi:hypothetical protein